MLSRRPNSPTSPPAWREVFNTAPAWLSPCWELARLLEMGVSGYCLAKLPLIPRFGPQSLHETAHSHAPGAQTGNTQGVTLKRRGEHSRAAGKAHLCHGRPGGEHVVPVD